MEKQETNKFLSFLNSTINVLAIMNLVVLFITPYLPDGIISHNRMIFYSMINIIIYSLYNVVNIAHNGLKNITLPRLLPFLVISVGIYLLFKNPEYFLLYISLKQLIILLKKFLLYAFEGRLWKAIINNPAISLMISFLMVIFVGALVLMLPIATSSNQTMNFIDAFFTSTSATCVTGLIVEDTGSYFSLFGQIVILILIQIGGLGIMTISTAFALDIRTETNSKTRSNNAKCDG